MWRLQQYEPEICSGWGAGISRGENMLPIDIDIITKFNENFASIKDEPIVLYGTGDKTKLIVDSCPEYHFIGIMDRDKKGECFNLPILSVENVRDKAKYIIIVCNISSADVIYQRIADFTEKNDIQVFHMSGRRMHYREKTDITKELIVSREAYENAIMESDVVSFDLFDTLIMRKCLYPDDLFRIMEEKLAKVAGEEQVDFYEKRKWSEREALLQHGFTYTLNDIYQIYTSETSQDNVIAKKLQEIELSLELEYVLPRKDVIELLNFASCSGKRIILVSDMYMVRDQVESLMKKCNISIDIFEDIYISNIEGLAKSDGSLWKHISEKYKECKIVHFGDNLDSDIKKARAVGICSLPIYSGTYTASVLLGNVFHKYENDLICRRIMGLLVADIFNSPFILDTQGRIKITSLRSVGYNFFAPLIKFFMDYLYEQVKLKEQKVLFCARDCWILKTVADKFYSQYGIENKYFLTSRRALLVATTLTDKDIDDAFSIVGYTPAYNFEEFCDIVFNIKVADDDPYRGIRIADLDMKNIKSYIKERYEEDIKTNSLMQKSLYKAYIESLPVDLDERLAIVNFVGGGRTQSLLEKLGIGNNSEFYYFAMTPLQVELSLVSPTHSVFKSGSVYTGNDNALVQYTVLGECIFSSPKSQFMGFTLEGPVYADDGINHGYDKISESHTAIVEYFQNINSLGLDFNHVPAEFINEIYGVLFQTDICNVSKEVKDAFQTKDIIRTNEVLKIWND